jgi:hypothetical protein
MGDFFSGRLLIGSFKAAGRRLFLWWRRWTSPLQESAGCAGKNAGVVSVAPSPGYLPPLAQFDLKTLASWNRLPRRSFRLSGKWLRSGLRGKTLEGEPGFRIRTGQGGFRQRHGPGKHDLSRAASRPLRTYASSWKNGASAPRRAPQKKTTGLQPRWTSFAPFETRQVDVVWPQAA